MCVFDITDSVKKEVRGGLTSPPRPSGLSSCYQAGSTTIIELPATPSNPT